MGKAENVIPIRDIEVNSTPVSGGLRDGRGRLMTPAHVAIYMALPCFDVDSEVRSYWRIAATDDYRLDCFIGTHLSRVAFRLQAAGHPGLVRYMLADMVKAGRMSGIEVGFLAEMDKRLPR